MAFNPFDVFRRNQRILFAGLTVVIMFMFVLSFGQGDLFQSIPRWVAARQGTGEVLAVVGGSKLYQSQLGDTDGRRALANGYMTAAGERAFESLVRSAQAALPKATASNKQVIENAIQSLGRSFVSQGMETRARQSVNPQFAGFFGPPPTALEIAADRDQTLLATVNQLQQVSKATDENDLSAARDVLRAIEVGERLFPNARAAGRGRAHYFWNQPANSNRDGVDFTLWLKKADDLGIRFTDEDVEELKAKEFHNQLDADDWKRAEAQATLRGGRSTRAELLSALADEFRVRAAQGAVLGQAYLKPVSSLYDAPADYFEFYRDQTAAARFGVVSVPAANYVSRVTAQPTDGQLRELFSQARQNDADPAVAKVGLREPRRLKIAAVEVTGEEAFYQKAAEEGAKALTVTGRVGGLLFAPPGPGLLSLVAGVHAAGSPNLALDTEYATYVSNHKRAAATGWYGTSFVGAPPRVGDTQLATPAGVAGITGALAGSLAGNPLQAAVAATGTAIAADRRARLDTVAPSFAGPVVSVGPNLGLLVALAAPQIKSTQPLARPVVEGQLADKFKKELTRSIANRDVSKFRDDLAKLNAKATDAPSVAAAQKFVAEFVAARGLKVSESTAPRDLYTLAEDPGLAAVAAAAGKPSMFAQASKTAVQKAFEFGRLFFFETDPATPGGRQVPSAGLFKPVQVPESLFGGRELTVPVTLGWRTAEQAAESPRDPNSPATREKVTAAWRKLEARKLARQAAEELSKRCENLGQDYVVIKPRLDEQAAQFRAQFPDGADKLRVRSFEIEKVAPLVNQVLTGQTLTTPFMLAPSDDIPYPTAKMRQALLDARTQPPSTAVVLTDAPEETYYVAVLLGRDVVRPELFAIGTYSGNVADAPSVRRAHQEALRTQARESAVALLKAEYGVTNESDALDKKSDGE